MVLLVLKNTSSRYQFASRFQEDRVITKHPNDGQHPCQALHLFVFNFCKHNIDKIYIYIYVKTIPSQKHICVSIGAKENFLCGDNAASVYGNNDIIICGLFSLSSLELCVHHVYTHFLGCAFTIVRGFTYSLKS